MIMTVINGDWAPHAGSLTGHNAHLVMAIRCRTFASLQKPHRLLPTNLYVVLYNFKARHQDELDLKAGYKVSALTMYRASVL